MQLNLTTFEGSSPPRRDPPRIIRTDIGAEWNEDGSYRPQQAGCSGDYPIAAVVAAQILSDQPGSTSVISLLLAYSDLPTGTFQPPPADVRPDWEAGAVIVESYRGHIHIWPKPMNQTEVVPSRLHTDQLPNTDPVIC